MPLTLVDRQASFSKPMSVAFQRMAAARRLGISASVRVASRCAAAWWKVRTTLPTRVAVAV